MKLLYKLRSYLASRKARRIRRAALHDYRLAMRHSERLEREALRLKRLSGALLLGGNATPVERLPWLPESKRPFTNTQLVQQ